MLEAGSRAQDLEANCLAQLFGGGKHAVHALPGPLDASRCFLKIARGRIFEPADPTKTK